MKTKKVGLALSGGGALGVAHIGVLQVFEENNIPIDIITGTSMGSLIGGIYCAGVSTQAMQDRIFNIKTRTRNKRRFSRCNWTCKRKLARNWRCTI